VRSVIEKLAVSLGRRDERPNQELAKSIALSADRRAVRELVENLASKDKNIQSDCIKVLYEIGERKPTLIAPYCKELITLLESKNNRLVWGAMIALDTITLEQPKAMYAILTKIIDVADSGSVITRDHAVSILIKLTSIRQYAVKTFPLLVKQLKTCPTNQLPMYAENALPIVNAGNKTVFAKTLVSRLNEVEKQPKRKRIEKVLKRVISEPTK
jgi:hypothetical protein